MRGLADQDGRDTNSCQGASRVWVLGCPKMITYRIQRGAFVVFLSNDAELEPGLIADSPVTLLQVPDEILHELQWSAICISTQCAHGIQCQVFPHDHEDWLGFATVLLSDTSAYLRYCQYIKRGAEDYFLG